MVCVFWLPVQFMKKNQDKWPGYQPLRASCQGGTDIFFTFNPSRETGRIATPEPEP